MTDLVQLTYWDETTQTEKDCYPVVAEQATRNVGEIISSALPLTDAGLHLLDGALIDGYGIYSAFVEYIASIYDASANYFCTEAEWQTAVTTYGVCGKFVYDSTNNTVRLPKYNSKIYTGGGTAPVVGNDQPIFFKDSNGQYVNFGPGQVTTDLASAVYRPVVNSTASLGGPVKPFAYPLKGGDSTNLLVELSNITTSLEGYYYIVIATSAKTDIQVDIDEIATDLNGKADVDLSNINPSQSAKDTIMEYGMPDYSSGISVSGNGFTASTDGIWYVLAYNYSAFFSFIVVNNITTTCGIGGTSSYQDQSAIAIYLSKGDVVTWSANPSVIHTSTFYPLKGVN